MTIQEAKVMVRRHLDWNACKDMRAADDAFSDLTFRIDTNEYAESLEVLIAGVESINCHECVHAVNANRPKDFVCKLGIKGGCKSFTRKEAKMIDMVNNPKHYKLKQKVEVECIDITRHLSFNRGNAFKYVWRAGKKGGLDKALEDLSKALWYVSDTHSWTIFQDDKKPVAAAVAVFNLLPKRDDSDVLYKDRYSALEGIVYHFCDCDVLIRRFIKAVKRQAMD